MHALKIYHFCQMNLSPSFPFPPSLGMKWILGPDFSRLHRSTSVILPDKVQEMFVWFEVCCVAALIVCSERGGVE